MATVAKISVHTSDRATWKRCRRKWDYTSPMRQNLQPKISSYGVTWPLSFGTLIHKVLELHYAGSELPMWQIFQDLFVTFIVEVEQQAPGYYEENFEEFDKHLDLGLGMMRYYEDYATRNDTFEMVESEHDFSVPMTIGIADVYYEGRMDGIIRDEHGRLGILETKTAATVDEEYLARLDLDEQVTSYVWSARKEGWHAEFVLYNILAKRYPKPPVETYGGKYLSVDRAQGTTLAMFLQSANEKNLIGTDWWESEKVVNYREYLAEQGDELYVVRRKVLRNDWQIQNCEKRIRQEVSDMLNVGDHVYPNPTGDWSCTYCAFRPPCLQAEDGSDPSYTLEQNYERRS